MKQINHAFFTLIIVAAGTFGFACADQAADVADGEQQTAEATPETVEAAAEDDTFYALGFAISRNLGEFHLTQAELEHVKRGLEDGVMGREPKIDLEAASQRIQTLAQERSQQAAETERKEGERFLSEAAAAEGAEKTESGLIIETIEEGTGATPDANDSVAVHYRGTLRDGTVFDSSYEGGKPAVIPLTQVIPCWSEGMQRMKVGGKAKLICPPELGYGDRAMGPIPPGSTLIFEVELLEIVEGAPAS
ncbi:MAG: FKBP-type peptidyl-prolyl cis-trans isomerase [Acidobacteria bacterium]|nr:FKBP-type peptidyl-prolyl cis-trans isomerase [Acidobacteriota bacterium]